MRTKAISTAVLGLAAFLAAGCASLPPKVSDTDSLVLIKTDVVDPQSAPMLVQYRFILESGYPPADVGIPTLGYMAFVVHGPGVKVSRITAKYPDIDPGGMDWGAGWGSGWSASYKADLSLPYEPGKAVVADFVFTRHIYYDSGGGPRFYTQISFRSIKPEEKARLLATVAKDKIGASWIAN